MLPKIRKKIHEIRDQKVLLDFDLAELYQVETRVLNQAVKRHISRFPFDFMFQLSKKEYENLISQNVISKNEGAGGTRKLPYAFTEQGVSMLSGILNSKKAILMNIAIMRAFVFLRQYAMNHQELSGKLSEMEIKYNQKFIDVYEALNYLLRKDQGQTGQLQEPERKRIGYKK
jgi:hypothetical protein